MSQGQTSIFICDERKLINKDLYDNVYLGSFGRKFIKIAFWSDSVDWFDAS